jgi:3-dehydroquinate synthase
MPTTEARVPVRLGPRSYDVTIAPGALGRLGASVNASRTPACSPVALVFDDRLPGSLVSTCERSLAAAGFRPLAHPLKATESNKTLARAGELLGWLAIHRLERPHPIIALGGGIVGDLAGFAAATYRRGVPVIQCPTTLLAMVDASVGGKTAVNLSDPEGRGELLKNMVGAFHQPRAVVIDTDALDSLPDRHFRSGLAECIKHGMLGADFGDPQLLDWTADTLDRIATRKPDSLVALIGRNLSIKASVVQRDEREELDLGGRALLNLGHTFAHAIETIPTLSPDGGPGLAPLQHGEAVALGLIAAATTSEAAGRCPTGLAARIGALIAAAELPVRLQGLPSTQRLLERMAHDKKVLSGKLRLILPVDWGRAAVFDDVPPAAIAAGWDAIRG